MLVFCELVHKIVLPNQLVHSVDVLSKYYSNIFFSVQPRIKAIHCFINNKMIMILFNKGK